MQQDIFIYGEIGKQVTLDTVLKSITPKATGYTVHIISNGGDVFEGYAIYNALKNTGKEITVFIEGVCASIATLIASAAPKGNIVMNDKSQFMIHNPRIASMSGDSKDLRNVAAQLDRIKSQLIDSWVGRTSLSREQLSEMYDNETWLTPEQAVQMGFADEVKEVLKAAASADYKKYKLMEDKKTLISRIEKMINNFFSPQNATETLADGTVIIVPDGEDWTGQIITTEDGAPLPAGEHALASGMILVIGEGGAVMEKREPVEDKEEKPEDMEAKQKLEAAEARIKELESALEAKTNEAAKAVSDRMVFENKLTTEIKAVKDELSKIKNTTVGDTTPPDKGIKNVPPGKAPVLDPMQALFGQLIIEPRK